MQPVTRWRKLLFALVLFLVSVITVLAIAGDRLLGRRLFTDGEGLVGADAWDGAMRFMWSESGPLPDAEAAGTSSRAAALSPSSLDLYYSRKTEGQGWEIVRRRRGPAGLGAPEPLYEINSESNDVDPVLVDGGRRLVFASDRPGGRGGYDLWTADVDGDGFGEPRTLSRVVNGESDDRYPAVTPDRSRLLFCSNRLAENGLRYELYESRRSADGFGPPTLIRDLAGDEGSEMLAPALSPDGRFLVFASDQDGGRGGYDLYRSLFHDGGWHAPEALDELNTEEDELDPAFSPEGSHLLFARSEPESQGLRLGLHLAERREIVLLREPGAAFWRQLLYVLAALLLAVILTYLYLKWSRIHPFVKFVLLSIIAHLLIMLFVDPLPSGDGGPGDGGVRSFRVSLLPSADTSSASAAQAATGDAVSSPRVAASAASERAESAAPQAPAVSWSAAASPGVEREARVVASTSAPEAPSRQGRRRSTAEPPSRAAAREAGSTKSGRDARAVAVTAARPVAAGRRSGEVSARQAARAAPAAPAAGARPRAAPSLAARPGARLRQLPDADGRGGEAPSRTAEASGAPTAMAAPRASDAAAKSGSTAPGGPVVSGARPVASPRAAGGGPRSHRGREAAASPGGDATAKLAPARTGPPARRSATAAREAAPGDRGPVTARADAPRPQVGSGSVAREETQGVRREVARAASGVPERPAVWTAPGRSGGHGLPGRRAARATSELAVAAPATGMQARTPARSSPARPPAGAVAPAAARRAGPAGAARIAVGRRAIDVPMVTGPRREGPGPEALRRARGFAAEIPRRAGSMPAVSRARRRGKGGGEHPVVAVTPRDLLFRREVDLPDDEGPPPAFASRRGKAKRRALEITGGSAETEAAVLAGLRYLARRQRRGGAWGRRHDDDKYGDVRIGKTGLALLAFLGSGYSHGEPSEFSETVGRGIRFLLGTQDPRHGHFGTAASYGHGIATYALAEAYAMTRDPEIRPRLAKAVRRIIRAQVSEPGSVRHGGWKYYYADPDRSFDDWPRMSVTVWQIMALKSARIGGLAVPERVFDRARAFTLGSLDPQLRAFRYNHDPRWLRSGFPTLPGSNSAALFALQMLGVPDDDPRSHVLVDYINERRPRFSWRRHSDRDAVERGRGNLYFMYYASLALHRRGGRDWQRWNDLLKPLLTENQESDGSWRPISPYAEMADDRSSDRCYTTSMCVLMLEVYYRYFTPLLADVARAQAPSAPASKTRIVVEEVGRGSRAQRAGLRSGDEIVLFGSRRVDTLDGLQNAMQDARGRVTAIIVKRRGRHVTLALRGRLSGVKVGEFDRDGL